MKKILVSVLAIFVLLSMVGCSKKETAKSVEKKNYTLKISTTQNETAPIVKGLYEMAKVVDEKTAGGLKIEVFPAGQLGVEEDIIEQALQGVNVAVLTDTARMSNYVKDIGILNMAYFVDNYDEAVKFMNMSTFKGWQDELVGKGVRVLCFNFYDGARSFMTNKPVKTPADLKGVRIRTPGAPVWVNSIESLGATPVAMAWGEVYNGIQSKALDGCEVQYTSAFSTRIYEVSKYINKTEHIQLINGLVTGEKWFATLPADYQKILLEAAYSCAYENAKYVEGLVQEIEGKLINDGKMLLVAVDLAAFKTASNKAYEKMGWVDLRKNIYAEMGKN